MADNSTIEWTETTWNPVTGCTRISEGCAHCYAERMARRLRAMGQPNYRRGFAVTCHPHLVRKPLDWHRPRIVFVNSMSDLFHKAVPEEFIQQLFSTMNQAQQHRFQILTKRSQRLAELAPRLSWTPNIWAGVTIESAPHVGRIDDLRGVSAAVRFLSLEPLLGPLPDLDLRGIHWVILGGESGPGARPMSAAWVRDIQAQCNAARVAFFFKQWGGLRKKANGRLLDGHTWDAMPGPDSPS